MKGSAVIVGAGIGGLAAGRALRAVGWQVDILERAEGLPRTGTALGMWPEAIAALDALGLGEQVRRRAVLQRGAEFLRPDGRTFARVTPQEAAYLISRPALHELLHDGTLESAVAWNSPVVDLDTLPAADLVVGADGINSQVRHFVARRFSPPRPLGTVAYRGTVPGSVRSVTETWGSGLLFGITPQDSGTTNWFACVRDDVLAEHDLKIDIRNLLERLYGGWHPAVTNVLAKVDPDQVDRRPLYDLAPLRSFVRDRTVVLGDAAHAMAPSAGRGACEALVDAVELANSLGSADSVAEGLRDFDARRRLAAQRVVRMSRQMNRLSTARRFTRARNVAMGAVARLI
ncbi:FAD-dependent monooxygenase [Pseudoclavibacter endophyticus]|uniref:FAD-dependent monooxygenase n=1 Tax=Pseudoclavibacter endophyticus TaxID=1778590 RepID=UPI001CE4815B|nr:FAD-dependent monooxygenase [Pseudoclavibacter endophyticus]